MTYTAAGARAPHTLRTIRDRLPKLTGQSETQDVHFHQGPQGQPVPCFDARCPNPRLPI